MAAVNPRHMIEEIQANVKSGDVIKARLVLAHLDKLEPKEQRRMLYELSRGEVDFAITLLLYVLEEAKLCDDNFTVAREALLGKFAAYPEKLPEYLENTKGVQCSEIMRVAGELRCTEVVPVLLDIAAISEEDSEIALIIETLGLLGNSSSVSFLTEYLYSANRYLIMAAVQSLGQLGTPTAMHRLAERMGTDNEIDFQILSIFASTQDTVSLGKLNDTLRSHHAHMRSYAKSELVAIGSKVVPLLIANLSHDDPDFLIHTLNVLGDIGDASAITPIRKLLDTMPKNANVRFAAYEALALLPLKKGAYTLTAGLTDPEEHVCVAAARAIDRNFTPILGAGIRNLLQGREDEARHIVKILVTTAVDRIFLSLIDDEKFQELAFEYLPHSHKDIREHYHALLVSDGRRDLAARFEGAKEDGIRQKVVAVDDSRMILNIYKSTLHELGYDPILFEFPASAIEWLKEEKPLLVLTDLNMPEITGIQLTRKVREQFSVKELPIVLVTTQLEGMDGDAALEAGVNAILHKPFNAKSLGKTIKQVLS